MVNLNYENADYYDGGTGLDKELVFNTLFTTKNGHQASIREEIRALKTAVELPDILDITEVRVVEQDDSKVDFIVSVKDLTVGTQTSRGEHPYLNLHSDDYSLYRVGIESMG